MNRKKSEVLRMIRSKKILTLVSAVAIGIAMFAAVGMLSLPQQAEASHKTVLKFGGVVGAPGFPIEVGGRVSGSDLNNLTGQSFDNPIQVLHRFFCLIELTGSSWDEAENVVTLTGEVINSNFPDPNDPSAPSPQIGVPVIFTVDLDDGFITFNFNGNPSGSGFGNVRLAGHP